MKQETKELINWIKIQLLAQTKDNDDEFNKKINKACNFLDSLPEIESHLCRGGYIQDKYGTLCCDGDKVINESILNTEPIIGTLYWSKGDARFYFKCNDTLYSLSKNLEKVKSQSKWDKIKKVTK